jgi:predicted nucleotidyltransferase
MVKKITATKVIGLYCSDYDKSYYLREIARLLGTSHQTIKPYVESLVRKKILQKHKRTNVVDYRLNWSNPKSFDMVVIAEKEKLMRTLEDAPLLEALYEKVSTLFKKVTFVIFGSAVDNVKKAADIDLLIVGRKPGIINEFEEVYNKKVHLVSVSTLSNLRTTLAREIYRKHLICNNTESVVNYFRELHEKNKLV